MLVVGLSRKPVFLCHKRSSKQNAQGWALLSSGNTRLRRALGMGFQRIVWFSLDSPAHGFLVLVWEGNLLSIEPEKANSVGCLLGETVAALVSVLGSAVRCRAKSRRICLSELFYQLKTKGYGHIQRSWSGVCLTYGGSESGSESF